MPPFPAGAAAQAAFGLRSFSRHSQAVSAACDSPGDLACVSVFCIGFVLACALLVVRWWEDLGWKVWFLPVQQVRQPELLQGGAGPQEPGLVPAGAVGLLLPR